MEKVVNKSVFHFSLESEEPSPKAAQPTGGQLTSDKDTTLGAAAVVSTTAIVQLRNTQPQTQLRHHYIPRGQPSENRGHSFLSAQKLPPEEPGSFSTMSRPQNKHLRIVNKEPA